MKSCEQRSATQARCQYRWVRCAETRPQVFCCTREKAGQRSNAARNWRTTQRTRKEALSLSRRQRQRPAGCCRDSSLQHKGVGLQQTAMSQTQGLVDKSVSVANIARAEEDAQRAASPESGGGRGRRSEEKRVGPAVEGCWW